MHWKSRPYGLCLEWLVNNKIAFNNRRLSCFQGRGMQKCDDKLAFTPFKAFTEQPKVFKINVII
jgi:hypothetical protein